MPKSRELSINASACSIGTDHLTVREAACVPLLPIKTWRCHPRKGRHARLPSNFKLRTASPDTRSYTALAGLAAAAVQIPLGKAVLGQYNWRCKKGSYDA